VSAGVILVDGRSGSGKTELAKQLAHFIAGAQLVRLDDLYPGWNGLDAGSARVPDILATLRWQAWDWALNRPDSWHDLDGTRPIIIEGVGAISRASRPLADIALWVQADDATRKSRAFGRDGDAFAEYWHSWAAQELSFIARESPQQLADAIVES
jgi:uridine kinase